MREKMFKIEAGILMKYTGTEENVKIPAGVKKIGYDAFRHNDHIMKIQKRSESNVLSNLQIRRKRG